MEKVFGHIITDRVVCEQNELDCKALQFEDVNLHRVDLNADSWRTPNQRNEVSIDSKKIMVCRGMSLEQKIWTHFIKSFNQVKEYYSNVSCTVKEI